MKFFCLVHSKLGYICLKNLISKNFDPDFIVIHKNYENEKLRDESFISIEDLCGRNKIDLYKVNSVNEIKNKIIGCDVGLCIGFMEILKRDFFDLPKFGILNLHIGKLPKYRGRAPICRTIMNDEKYLTMTLHTIDEGVDSGDICNELQIEIKDEDDVNTLYEKGSQLSSEFIIDSLSKLENGKLKFIKQNLSNKPNKVISEDERKINWNDCHRKIFNLIRAVTFPYPTAYSIYKKNHYIFLGSEIIKTKLEHTKRGGEISEVNKNYLVIKCHGGSLKIKKILNQNFEEVNYLRMFSQGEFFDDC